MNAPVDEAVYPSLVERLRREGLLSDPWFCGKPRFSTEALTLPANSWRLIAEAAEAMTAAHQDLVALVAGDEALLDAYFSLGPVAKALWQCSAPAWHGVARADIFLTAKGPRFCEINCDTPSGQPEAMTLSRLFANLPGRDPNAALAERFCAYLEFTAHRLGKTLAHTTVGILYPTELTEDLGLVLLYERWLVERGARVVLGSPFNLGAAADGRVALLGQPCDLVVRHYKTDWWVERQPVWLSDAPFPDSEPLTEALALLLSADLAGKTAVVNPFGAIVPQNKRSLALLWEEQTRLSPDSQAAVQAYLPPTFRLETLSVDEIRRHREEWVLKSDYGCEGEETIVGRATCEPDWERCLAEAVPGRWIAQRAFDPVRDDAGCECNLGVYLVAGAACGLYARRSLGPTDASALSTAVRIGEDDRA
jgi:glutathionylspermidine synthase